MPIGLRRKAREAAVQVLYSLDVNPVTYQEALRRYWLHFIPDPELKEFTQDLVEGVMEHKEEIDQIIATSSKNWKFDRMARVDRNILRLATFELMFRQDIPVRVSINEAIEIARRFSTEEARAFINGILDRIATKVRPASELP